MRGGWTARAATVAALLASAGGAFAQEDRIPVVVEDVTAAEFYVGAGTDAGLVAGDTLRAASDSSGGWIGALHVLSASTLHARMGFAGRAFSVTRGATLWIERPVVVPVAPAAPPVLAEALRPYTPAAPRAGPTAHGRISFDVDGSKSAAHWADGTAAAQSDRSTTISAARLRLTVDDLPGGWRMRTFLKAAYRYDDLDPIEPATSLDVSEATLERDFRSLPLSLTLGRFYGRFGPSGGVWDGAMMRLGGAESGVGVAAGFQPEAWTRAPSFDTPRAAVFLEHGVRGHRFRWSGTAALHLASPSDSLENPAFFELSQTLGGARARTHQDVVIEREPGGGWRMSRLLIDGSVPLSERLTARARYALRRPHPFRLDPSEETLDERHDGFGGGLSWSGPSFGLSVDASANRITGGDWSRAATMSLQIPRLGVQGIGFAVTATWWADGDDHGLLFRPGFTTSLGALRLRAGYAGDRTTTLGDDLKSDAIEGDAWLPLAGRWSLTLRGRRQWGGLLDQTSLHLGLSTSF